MAREKGELSIASSFEVESAKPLDPRGLVDNKSDLILTETWEALDGNTYVYPGMIVSVNNDVIQNNNGIYRLTSYDYTIEDNWVNLSSPSHNELSNLQGGVINDYQHLTTEQLSLITGLTINLDNKVDKITGKGLSSEDYTLDEKIKLSGITGLNSGDETEITIKNKLGITILSGNNTGDQDLSYLQPKESGKTLVSITDIEKIHNQNTDNTILTPDKTKTVLFTDNLGNLYINGNIFQSGSTYQTHAEEIYTTKNEIILRENALGGLNTNEYTGLIAKKYDGLNDGRLGFNKDGIAVVGDVNNEQPIATRELTPIDQGISYWDNISSTFKTKNLEINDINNLSNIINSKENTITTGTTSQYYRGDKTWQTLNSSTVGLGNVDNTSDVNKPISTLTQNALNQKQNNLDGLGFIKISGQTISYINDNYLSLSGGTMNNINLINNLNSELLNGLKSNEFSLTAHTHNIYEPLITGKTNGYVKYENSNYVFVNESYSLSGHNHNELYQPIGNYLTNNQNITIDGDVSGSGTTGITLTLKSIGTSGIYTKVTTDSNGRVISGNTLLENDIPLLSWNKINSGTTPTTLSGYGIINASDINHKHYQLYTPDGISSFVFTDNANNLHINGNIIQSGSTYQTHAEQIYTEKNEIILRENAISGMIAGEYCGLIAKNYDGVNDGRLGFDKDGFAVVGDVNNEQKIATRENNPVNFGFAYWNDGFKTFLTKTLDASDVSETSNLKWLTSSLKSYYDNKQEALNGIGFIKISGTTVSYDNIDYQPLNTAINTTNISGQSVNYSLNSGNADKLDNLDSTAFSLSGHTHSNMISGATNIGLTGENIFENNINNNLNFNSITAGTNISLTKDNINKSIIINTTNTIDESLIIAYSIAL